MGTAGTTDVVDASLVSLAAGRGAEIVTSDRADIRRLVAKARPALRIVDL